MSETTPCDSIHALRDIVHERLCDRESLVRELFPLTERAVRKGDSICGMQFTLHGPRNVRLSAVWTADRNTLYLYDTRGQRFDKVDLQGFFSVTDEELLAEPV